MFGENLPGETDAQRQQSSQVNNIQHHLREVRGFSPQVVQAAMPKILDELHRLIATGVLRPGPATGYELPWLTVTEWGEEALRADGPPIYEADAYLDHLASEVPDLPDIAALYLREAVASFNLSRTIAAAVMLGVATEAVLVHVIEAFAHSSMARDGAKLLQSLEREPILRTYRAFTEQLDRKALPPELERDLDVFLGNVLHFIRMTRNEAGHPTGVTVERPVIEAQLRAFEGYAKRLCALAEHFIGKTSSGV